MKKVAVLIDLPRGDNAGGHVIYWQNLAQAAARLDTIPFDLTLYFSGSGADEILSPHVRYRYLLPVFSTAKLKFMPPLPAHTDLAPFHPRLAQELQNYDIIHTTDAFFAFAQTAEHIARWHKIPLVTSLHTDTPAYAEIFTRATLEHLCGQKIGAWLDTAFKISARARAAKNRRLAAHIRSAHAAIIVRDADRILAETLLPSDKISSLHLGVDKEMFAPDAAARAEIEKVYAIPPGKFLALFVGRVDVGKNMPLLLDVCEQVVAHTIPLHLIVAGQGPMTAEVKQRLGANATLAGQVPPAQLARLYAAADCLTVVSAVEIGGLVALEALSCGCPVLVSRQSDVAQAANATDVMQMVTGDATAWARALSGLAQDSERQQEMRAAALRYRREKLRDWTDVLKNDFMPVWQKTGALCSAKES